MPGRPLRASPRPALAVLILALVAGASSASPHARSVPFGGLGATFGAGSAERSSAGGHSTGFMGSITMDLSLSHSLAWGMDARYWVASRDTIETDLVLAGPYLSWQPWDTGPMVRGVFGVAYEHDLLKFADVSSDSRLDGTGAGVSVAYEFRVTPAFAFGPQLDYSHLWLAGGRSATFVGATLGLELYLPRR
jgi:hypothetical protein